LPREKSDGKKAIQGDGARCTAEKGRGEKVRSAVFERQGKKRKNDLHTGNIRQLGKPGYRTYEGRRGGTIVQSIRRKNEIRARGITYTSRKKKKGVDIHPGRKERKSHGNLEGKRVQKTTREVCVHCATREGGGEALKARGEISVGYVGKLIYQFRGKKKRNSTLIKKREGGYLGVSPGGPSNLFPREEEEGTGSITK